MSIVQYDSSTQVSSVIGIPMDNEGKYLAELSKYDPSDEVKNRLREITKAFSLGDMNMQKPRREYNDMAVLDRMTYDQMAFNTYQPNNGDYPLAEEVQSWRSRAVRPVVRNKCISIAAHATARLIFPKIFAVDDDSNEEKDSAIIMEDLMEWANDQSDYPYTSLLAVLTALWSPASIVFTGYDEIYRTVRKKQEDGTYKEERILDETFSGFNDSIVPIDVELNSSF